MSATALTWGWGSVLFGYRTPPTETRKSRKSPPVSSHHTCRCCLNVVFAVHLDDPGTYNLPQVAGKHLKFHLNQMLYVVAYCLQRSFIGIGVVALYDRRKASRFFFLTPG